MQAATRSKRFVIDHRIITMAVAIVALIVVTGGAALLTTTRTADPSGADASVAEAQPSVQQFRPATDRPASMAGVTSLDTTSDDDLDRADQLTQYMLATQARQAALTSQASDRTIWTAFSGHAGFTVPEGEGSAMQTRTYYPGHPGFIIP